MRARTRGVLRVVALAVARYRDVRATYGVADAQ